MRPHLRPSTCCTGNRIGRKSENQIIGPHESNCINFRSKGEMNDNAFKQKKLRLWFRFKMFGVKRTSKNNALLRTWPTKLQTE